MLLNVLLQDVVNILEIVRVVDEFSITVCVIVLLETDCSTNVRVETVEKMDVVVVVAVGSAALLGICVPIATPMISAITPTTLAIATSLFIRMEPRMEVS